MRKRITENGITALGVAGNHVVLLGWDVSRQTLESEGILGFAIGRRRDSDDEFVWLKGLKTFEATEPDPAPGVLVSSRRHPFQTFQWGDYSVAPNASYEYRIVALTGTPHKLVAGRAVSLRLETERVDLGEHAVFFNRGAVASQEYARRFLNRPPDQVGPAAYRWLSRGLVEGLERFIAQAEAGDELFGAFFEFKTPRIYEALLRARQRGATIEILYDGDSQGESNEGALEHSGIQDLVRPRERSGGFAHNKFLVLRRAGASQEVWTGSTNLSVNGIFGHSNNAHLVRNPHIAEQYYAYWQILNKDQTKKPTAIAVQALSPAPPAEPWNAETSALFSPRPDLEALDWYARLAGAPGRPLFTTFAFGMNQRFVDVYERADGVLRFALMEKKGNGAQFKKQAAQIDQLRRLPNVVVSVGHRVEINTFDRWLAEIDRIVTEAHVLYVHTKYMLIDPLGDEPIVIVGSANFSESSTDANDENMLVIRGNAQVADIYLGEFMRLFSHYAFRESLSFAGGSSAAAAPQRKYLAPDASWARSYYAAGGSRDLRRRYFSGQ